MNILKLSKIQRRDFTELYLKKLWGKEDLNFFNKENLFDHIEVCHLNEGDMVGPWNKGDEKKVWYIKSGSLRSFLKVDKFNEISIGKCCRDKFVGLYENLSNWNNSYFLASDKETELIGIPFDLLLEISNLSKTNYPFNDAYEN